MIKMKVKDFNKIDDADKVDVWMKARKLLVREAAEELGVVPSTLWTYRARRFTVPRGIIRLITLDLKARGNLTEK